MKILLIGPKGALAEALARQPGVEVVGVWPNQMMLDDLTGRVRALHYPGGHKLNPRAVWQIRQILRDERPDVVHAFFGRPLAHAALAASTMRHRPKIVSLRGIVGPLSWHNVGDWITYWHPVVDAHACESEAVRAALMSSGIPAARCSVVYNCMSERQLPRPGHAALREFNVPDNAFVVTTMAAMRPIKGIDLLLKAAIACADLPNLYIVLFGRVIDERIRELASDPRIRDRVRLPGHRADARELVSGANVLAMPSRAEGVAHALLEAMHQGVCPLVSDAGAMKEVVRHEQDGLVVPCENVEALAGAIRLLHDDRALTERLAASARQRVQNEFNVEKMAERLLRLYRSVLNDDAIITNRRQVA